MKTHLILYVFDQFSSTQFYHAVLAQDPTLNVPGMTEFTLGEDCILGLMPLREIARLLGDAEIRPDESDVAPRAELYLRTPEAVGCFERALALGARELSPMLPRDWGDVAGYVRDPDGHVVAFAMLD